MKIKVFSFIAILIAMMGWSVPANAQNWQWTGEQWSTGTPLYIYSPTVGKFLQGNATALVDIASSPGTWTITASSDAKYNFKCSNNYILFCWLSGTHNRYATDRTSYSNDDLYIDNIDSDLLIYGIRYHGTLHDYYFTIDANGSYGDVNSNTVDDKTAYNHWQFISVAQYNTYNSYLSEYNALKAYLGKDIPNVIKEQIQRILALKATYSNGTYSVKTQFDEIKTQCDNFLAFKSAAAGTISEDGLDATSAIYNPDANHYDASNSNYPYGWITTTTSVKTDDGWGGTKNFFETAGWYESQGNISQTITNLPNGRYELTVYFQASTGTVLHVNADNGYSGEIGGNGVGWEEIKVVAYVNNNILTINAVSQATDYTDWCNFDHFTLIYFGTGASSASYSELLGLIKKLSAMNTVLHDSNISLDISAAQGIVNSKTSTADEITTAIGVLRDHITSLSAVNSLVNGTFDTNPVYLKDGSISSSEANGTSPYYTSNNGNGVYVYNTYGWSATESAINSNAAQGVTGEYGSTLTQNGTTPPATDMFGKDAGAALHLSCGWGDKIVYSQTLSNLPAGKYMMYFEAYNAGVHPTIQTDLCGLDYKYNESQTFDMSAWSAHVAEVLVHETGNVSISLGMSNTGTSNNWAKLWIDNVEIYRVGDAKGETPVIANGSYYYLKTQDGKYISRGASWGTEATIDEFGIALQATNNELNETILKYVDWALGLYCNYDGSVYTDCEYPINNGNKNTRSLYWVIKSYGEGYTLYNTDFKKYLVIGNGVATMGTTPYVWTLEPISEHAAAMDNLRNEQATAAAEIFNLGNTTTEELIAKVNEAVASGAEENSIAINAFENTNEYYQGSGVSKNTINITTPGLYKFSVPAYTRVAGYNDAYALRTNQLENPVTYIYFGSAKTQLHSIFDEISSTTGDGWITPTGAPAGQTYPNNTTNGASMFQSGKYTNDVWVFITEPGTYEYGLAKPYTAYNGNWTWYGTPSLTHYDITNDYIKDHVHYYFGKWNSINAILTNDVPVVNVEYANVSGQVSVNPQNVNGLVFNKTNTISGMSNNVVNNNVCANLVLQNGNHTFINPKEFTATKATYNLSAIAGGEYGTLMLPYAASLPAGGEAYTMTEEVSRIGGDIYAEVVENNIQPNMPTLITMAGEYKANEATISVVSPETTYTNGFLTGTYAAMSAPVGSYVLQNHTDGGGVAFYLVSSTIQPTVNPFRAFVPVQENAARSVRVKLGNETGIEEIIPMDSQNHDIYDLSGRKVTNMNRGIYIINGKKIVLK